ncbi:MAG: hypothetical protein LBC64_02270 [Fibromonadaceae bacterium]|jgi:FlaA1/EpsC-like NDP-sugar epimerase|nr:hypothetical protein [Fibromonadaceae bacterium]
MDFLNNSIDDFLLNAKDKKLVIFGAFLEGEKALKTICEPNNIIPAYFVDNDFRKHYGCFWGYKIYEPSVLIAENKENTIVLIATQTPFRIKDQIERMGVIHYYSSLLFIEPVINKRQILITF